MRFVASVVIKPSGDGPKQIKDDVKGIGDSARGASNYVAELEGKISGLKEAAAGLAAVFAFDKIKAGIEEGISAIIESRESFAQLEAGVRSTGGAAGFTADGLRELAEQQQKLTGINHETVEGAESILLTFTRIGKQVFPQATAATLDLATRMKEDASTAALQLGKALNEPIAGATALRRIGVQLSESQVEQIKKFAALHDIVGADNVILAEMAKEFGGSAAAMHEAKGGLDDLHNAAQELWEQFGQALLPAVQQLAAEFTTLSKDPAFLQEITDVGRSLGGVLLATGHAAEFLIQNWEILKLGFVFMIALELPGHLVKVVKAMEAFAVASRTAALANPVTAIATVLVTLGIALNDYATGLKRASEQQIQHDVEIANDIGNVGRLREEYGKLTADQVAAASASLDRLKADRTEVEKELADVQSKLRVSQEIDRTPKSGTTFITDDPARAKAAALTTKQYAALEDESEKLQLQLKNQDNVIGHMEERLKGHQAAIAKTGQSTSDWGAKVKQHCDLLAGFEKSLRSVGEAWDVLRVKSLEENSEQILLMESALRGKAAYDQMKASLSAGREEKALEASKTKELTKLQDLETDTLAKLAEQRKAGTLGAAQYASAVATVEVQTKKEVTRIEAEALALGLLLEARLADQAATALALSLSEKLNARAQEWAASTAKVLLDLIALKRELGSKLSENEAQFADWQAQTNAVQRFGAGIAGILQQYGLLSRAEEDLAIKEEIRQRIEKDGLDILAKQVGLQGVWAQAQIAVITQQVTASHAAIDAIRQQWADADIQKWMTQPILDGISQYKQAGIDAFNTWLETGKFDVTSFAKTFLDITIKMIEEWLKRWLEAIAVRNAADSGGSAANAGGGGGSWLSGLGSLAGGGGAGGTAGGVTGNTWGTTFVTGPGGGASTSAAAGYAGAGAVIAAFVAAYFVVQSWIAHHRREFEQFRVSASDIGSFTWSLGSSTAGVDHLASVADQMVKTLAGIVRNIGGILEGWTGDLTVSRSGHGKHTEYWVQFGNGLVERFGNDAEAAFQFATVQAIKQAKIGGLPEEVRSAIAKSAAQTVDQLNSEIAAAFEKVATRLGETGYKVFQIFQKYALNIDDEIRKALSSLTATPSLSSRFGGSGSGAEQGPGIDNGGLNTKAGGRLSVEATIAEVQAVADLVAARNREVEAIRNSLIGVDDSGAQRLAQIDSFNKGLAESRGVVQAEIDFVQQQLAALGDKTGEQADKLRAALNGYLEQLGKIPEAISGQQLQMAVFHVLDEFLPHTRKYDLERVQFAKLEADLKLQEIKLQLVALGIWDQWAKTWQDAYNNAQANAGKPAGGHGGHQQAEKDWQTTLQGILDGGKPLLAQWLQLQQSEQDLRDKAKAAHASAAELAAGLAALDAQFKASVRQQAYQLAGVGTDFTSQLQGGLDFFAQLKELGRVKTGIPDWLREVLEGKFLDKMKASWQAGVDQIAGISTPFSQIDQQAGDLRQNLVALAAATHMTAAQVLEASVAIDHAADMAKQAARNSIEDELFKPLEGLPEWQGRIVELKRDELELEYEILKAKLVEAGLWEKDKAVWQAAHDASVAALSVAQTQLSASEREAAIQADKNMVAGYDLVKAQQDAAAKFLQAAQTIDSANKALLTDKTLSPLSPGDQRAALLSQYEDTLAKARGGDINALNAYAGVRQQFLDFEKTFSKSGPEYAALFERVFREGAGLVLDPGVEQATVQNLISQQTAQAIDASAQQHADLLAVRSSVIDGLNGLALMLGQPANILNGVPHFASGGIANRPSVLGEAGPEAAVPLPDGRNIPVALFGTKPGGDDGKTAKEVRNQGQATVGSIKRLATSLESFVSEQRETNAKFSATLNAALRGASLAGGQATVRKKA